MKAMEHVLYTISGVEMEFIRCGGCGIYYGVPESWLDERRKDGVGFRCPNGCSRVYRETEADRLKKRLARNQQILDSERTQKVREREARQRAERRLSATKGVVTRIKEPRGQRGVPVLQPALREPSAAHGDEAPDVEAGAGGRAMTTPKVHCFVETGEYRQPKLNEPFLQEDGLPDESDEEPGVGATCYPILRRLPDDWLERAVERLRLKAAWPIGTTTQQILAAILGPDPEPEPEEWEVGAAQSFFAELHEEFYDATSRVNKLARHFAKYRKAQERNR